jgi:hypothetical protein
MIDFHAAQVRGHRRNIERYCNRSDRPRAAVPAQTDCGGARSIRAIRKESGAAAISSAGGVRILHGPAHLGLMEFQQQKVSPAVEAMVVALR